MRILRVLHSGKIFYASLDDRRLHCLDKNLGFDDPIPLADVRALPPVSPSKIVGVTLNSRVQANSLGLEFPVEPEFYLKPPTALVGPGETILLPYGLGPVALEGTLALVIGKTARRVDPVDVPDHLFGYCCAGDVTAVELAGRENGLCRAKAFDTFLPLGPWIETEAPDFATLPVSVLINGQIQGQAPLTDYILSPYELVAAVSHVMTLTPGDVVLCGATAATAELPPGCEVRVEIPGLGLLINPVLAEPRNVQ